MMGRDNDDTIGPQAFASVCAKHGLLKLIDLEKVKTGSLLALSMDSEQEKKWAEDKVSMYAHMCVFIYIHTHLFHVA
jgi:hypothetical protein